MRWCEKQQTRYGHEWARARRYLETHLGSVLVIIFNLRSHVPWFARFKTGRIEINHEYLIQQLLASY